MKEQELVMMRAGVVAGSVVDETVFSGAAAA
jgi:hypothetical protein